MRMRRDENGQVEFGKLGLALQIIIVASLVALAIETLPNLSARTKGLLKVFDTKTFAVFTTEYIARIALSRNRWRYVFSFFGIIDLLTILPFFFAVGLELRSVKALRLLRLFRLLKLARYSAAMRRMYVAIRIIREELVLFGLAAGIMLYLAAFGIYYFENEAQPEKFGSVFHCLWWALTTLTTVGYGDAYPITFGGKGFTFLVLVVGLGVVAVPTGLFASALSKVRRDEDPDGDSIL